MDTYKPLQAVAYFVRLNVVCAWLGGQMSQDIQCACRKMTMEQLCMTFVLPLPGSTAVPDSIDCHVKKTLKQSLKLCLQDVREN